MMQTTRKINIKELIDARIISLETGQKIVSFYSQKKDKPQRLTAIFGVLGSLLVGLGIILILAHNWDEFSRASKTVIAFVPLVVGQLFAGYAYFKKKSQAWRESAATFLFLAVGASISLVSQVYNISGDFDSFMLTWILLAAPLIYLLRSHAAVLLHLLFSTVYACYVGYGEATTPWLYLPLFAFVIPHYLQLLKNKPEGNITGIFNWLLPISVGIVLPAFALDLEYWLILLNVCYYALLYNIGKLPQFDQRRLRANGYAILGSLGTVWTLMMMTFSWFWDYKEIKAFSVSGFFTFGVILLSLGTVFYILYKKDLLMKFNLFQYAFILFAMITFFGFSNPNAATILTNILVLALGVFAIKIGSDRENFGVLNYGLLIITILIACRFFDTEIPFYLRGLLFVAIGVGFFLTNYVMIKRQKRKQLITKNQEL